MTIEDDKDLVAGLWRLSDRLKEADADGAAIAGKAADRIADLANALPVPEYELDGLYGNCPVQAEGTIKGVPFYFRSRGERWSLAIGADPLGKPDWLHVEPFGHSFEAGWIEDDLATSFIEKALSRYAAGLPGATIPD